MGKNHAKKKPTRSRWFNAGEPLAKSRGLFILEEGEAASPLWTVYSISDGRPVLGYRPSNGNYNHMGKYGSNRSNTKDFKELFTIANALAYPKSTSQLVNSQPENLAIKSAPTVG